MFREVTILHLPEDSIFIAATLALQNLIELLLPALKNITMTYMRDSYVLLLTATTRYDVTLSPHSKCFSEVFLYYSQLHKANCFLVL